MVRNYKRKTPSPKYLESAKKKLKKARMARAHVQAIKTSNNTKQSLVSIPASEQSLESLAEILKTRIKMHKRGKMYDCGTEYIFCHHIALIGSSQIVKLTQPKYSVSQIHNRISFKGAKVQGREWENEWQATTGFYCDDVYYNIVEQARERFRQSVKMPFIGATPDFISLLEVSKRKFWCAIEIKSAKRLGSVDEYLVQLKVAMSCFSLKIGFLVVYTTEVPERYIYRVEENDYIEENKEILFKNYCIAVTRLFKTGINNAPAIEVVEDKLSFLLKPRRQPRFDPQWLEEVTCDRTKCTYQGKRLGYSIKRSVQQFKPATCGILEVNTYQGMKGSEDPTN